MVRPEILNNIDVEQERMQRTGEKRMPLYDNVLEMLGGLLQPQQDKFDHINLDMGFTDLDKWDRQRIENLSTQITICDMWGLEQSRLLHESDMETICISSRSKSGRAMELFNTTVTKSDSKFREETDKKSGFNFFPHRKKGG